MSTEAEIAVGHALYEDGCKAYAASDLPWDCLDEDAKQRWIKRGMTIVRAYQRAAWREPTAKDIRERKLMLTTNSYMRGGGKWSLWDEPRVVRTSMKSDEFDDIRVQDLPPLPEPKL